jgi:hypothetical protein
MRTRLALAGRWLMAQRLARPGDVAVLVSASRPGAPDSLQVIHVARPSSSKGD